MHARNWLWLCNGALLLGGVAWWSSQRAEQAALASEVAALRVQAEGWAKLQAEQRRLTAQQVPLDERERLKTDHEALARMKEELNQLEQRAQARGSGPATGGAAGGRDRNDPPAPEGAGPMLAVGEWKKAGRATPAAAFETMMWAAAGGDLPALAETLFLSKRDKARVTAALADLPEATRAAYATPEEFVALFTAKAAPLGGLQVTKTQIWEQENSGVVWVRLKAEDGKIKEAMFQVRWAGEAWQIMVPEAVVAQYTAEVKGTKPK